MRVIYTTEERATVPLTKGDILRVKWDGRWYPATHIKVDKNPNYIWVKWADGGENKVKVIDVRRMKSVAKPKPVPGGFKVGQPVLARYTDGYWYPAKVITGKDDKVVVKWDDGGETTPVDPKFIRDAKAGLSAFDEAAQGDDSDKVAYLKLLWLKLNAEKFNGKLTIPTIGIMRSVAVDRFRNRGYWKKNASKGIREIKINRNVFGNEDQLYETFLHEMCHQATNEISYVYGEPNGGHGPVWAEWMVKVGLNPLRYDKNDNTTYMTEEELEENKQRRDALNQAKQENEPANPREFALFHPVKWFHPGQRKWFFSMIISGVNKGKKWVVGGVDDTRYWTVSKDLLFKVTPAEAATITTDENKKNAMIIDAFLKRKKEARKVGSFRRQFETLVYNLKDELEARYMHRLSEREMNEVFGAAVLAMQQAADMGIIDPHEVTDRGLQAGTAKARLLLGL